jgi:hypothetical protein
VPHDRLEQRHAVRLDGPTVSDDLDQRLAAARQRAEKREGEAMQREKERALARIERDEHVLEAMSTLGGPDLLGKDFGRVDVDHADGTPIMAILVRKPKVATWRSFQAQLDHAKGVERDALHDKLWRACLAWPEQGKVEALIIEQPFARDRLCNAVGVLAGIREEDIAGKS